MNSIRICFALIVAVVQVTLAVDILLHAITASGAVICTNFTMRDVEYRRPLYGASYDFCYKFTYLVLLEDAYEFTEKCHKMLLYRIEHGILDAPASCTFNYSYSFIMNSYRACPYIAKLHYLSRNTEYGDTLLYERNEPFCEICREELLGLTLDRLDISNSIVPTLSYDLYSSLSGNQLLTSSLRLEQEAIANTTN